jgi:hypothetical protein
VITFRVVSWAAQECAWQQSGALSVAHMVNAWRYAHRRRHRGPRWNDVLMLGVAVEPLKNFAGLRTVGVRVDFDLKLDPQLVPDALRALLEAAPDSPSEHECVEWFRRSEDIHPFVDGNGRTGSILYNWLRGSLAEPVYPPNLWRDHRREIPSYPEVDV